MEFLKQWEPMTPGRSAKVAVIETGGTSDCGEYISGFTHFRGNNGRKEKWYNYTSVIIKVLAGETIFAYTNRQLLPRLLLKAASA